MERADKIREFLKRNIYLFLVIIASAIYVCRGLIGIEPTGKSIGEMIADFFLAFIFGISLSKLLGMQGIQVGNIDERVIKTQRMHSRAVASISPKIGELDSWCDHKTTEMQKSLQTKLLASVGISYQEFEEVWVKGNLPTKYATLKDVPRPIRRAIYRTKHLHITPLTAAGLTSEDVSKKDPFALGDDKLKHLAKSDVKRIGTKILVSVAFGMYGVRLIDDFNVSDLIWVGIQIVVFLMFGAITFLQNYFYMTDTYRYRIVRKIDYLEAFRNEMKLPALTTEREDDEEPKAKELNSEVK